MPWFIGWENHKMNNENITSLKERVEFLECMNEGIMVFDMSGKVLYVNPAYERITGLTKKDVEGKHVAEITSQIVKTDDIEIINQRFGSALEGKPLPMISTTFIRRDGSEIPIYFTASFIRVADEEPTAIIAVVKDVRDLKKTEDALRVSEEKFRLIFEYAPISISITDPEGLYLDVNKKMCEKNKVNREDIIGHRIMEKPQIACVEDPNENNILRQKLLKKGCLSNEEIHLIRPINGERTTGLLSSQLINIEGKPHIITMLLDITERKKAEDALKESEERYRALVESASDVVFRADNMGCFTFVNPAAMRISGYSEDEIIGEHFSKFIPREMRGKVIRLLVRQREKRIPNTYLEFPVLTKQGHEMWIGQNTQLLEKDGNDIGFQSVARDITDRKKAEDALSQKNSFIESLLRAIPLAVFYKDKEGKYLGCNDMFTEIMGATSEQIRGRTVQEIWPSELAEKCHTMDLELMRNREHQVYEYKIQDNNGRMCPVIYAKDVFMDKEGEVAGMVGTFLDMTERKKVEEEKDKLEAKNRQLQKSESLARMA